jgi:DNA-binding response OmpR family regulator
MKAPPTPDGSARDARAPRRILIVDDEVDITRSLKLGLERLGFQVDTFNDPVDALAKIKPGRYDLAIFDIRMPRMTGFELYRRFRKIDGHTDVCFITAYEVLGSEFTKLFPDIKASGFFKKPISIKRLAGDIDNILDGGKPHNPALRQS